MSSKENTQFNWRPNFKIESTLPDIKLVRTDFAINFVVLVLVLISVAVLIQREYQSYLLRASIGELEQQVRDNNTENNGRLKKSGEFRELARNIQELQRFFKVPFFAHEVMFELTSLKPEDMVFSRVGLSESITKVGSSTKDKEKPKVVFEINIAGDVQDLPVLTEFKRKLEESSIFNSKDFELNIDENMQQRDVDTGIIPFQITVSLVSKHSSLTSGKGVKR